MSRVCQKCGTVATVDPKNGCQACGASVFNLVPVKR